MQSNVYLFSTSSHPQAIHINSLDITYFKPAIDFSSYDYFILTSKQAVESLKQYKSENLKPALCISKQTAKAYEKIGGSVLAVGKGYGDTLEVEIKRYAKDTQWIYLRAENIASDFIASLEKEHYCIDSIIIYKSDCSKKILDVEVDSTATFIFTSPSSVTCFLKKHTIASANRVIVIGATTAKSLPPGIRAVVAQEKTIQSCIELINK